MPPIAELFRPRPRPPVSVCELLALDLGWPESIAVHFAAFEAGIRDSNGWTRSEINHLVFLRLVAGRPTGDVHP